MCTKPMPPGSKLAKSEKKEEKKEEKKKEVAPKKEAAGGDDEPAKKPKSELDLLPPTPFDLFNFKTFFVNHPDKGGKAIDLFLNGPASEEFQKEWMFDKDGWSVHHMHYEMYVDSKGVRQEGNKVYHTENMVNGFLQRWEDFRKFSFGKMCVLGTEDCQEIMGVFMWRGHKVPKECEDHPSFEYYKRRQLDLSNADDIALVRQYWNSKEGDTVSGMPVLSSFWQK